MRILVYSAVFVLLIPVFGYSQRPETPFERYGDVMQLALPISAITVTGAKNDMVGLQQLAAAIATETAVTFALKPLVKERRPDGGAWSFPSGHTAIAFTASSFLWFRYGKAYGIPATILAASVGYSRVRSKRHYWHDVIAGAAIGTLSSYLFTRAIHFSIWKDGAGITYAKSFP